jgi:hypothetical protein
MYRSLTIPRFWELFEQLPPDIQTRAEKNYELFSSNPGHPSLHLKRVGGFWSVRITDSYRALAVRDGNEFTWVWIGPHDEYDRILG